MRTVLGSGLVVGGVSASYVVATNLAKDFRGLEDWKNPFVGGFTAGAILALISKLDGYDMI
jgi:hypothetical protein